MAHRVRSYGSVSGPLLEEILDSYRILVDLSELSEDMLWYNIGIFAGQEYRFKFYPNLGYSLARAPSSSPAVVQYIY